jgi:serine/threonine-protein kinase
VAVKRTNLQERYELKEVLGRGGMGVVYKAYDTLMKRDVALKTIIDIDNPATVQLFYKEWSILATMVHPNVVNIYDIGEFEQNGVKQPFFVMPLLPGVTLDRLIKEGSPRLSVTGTLEIIEQACRGLHAAHEQGLVHRDVKPSNIFVMDDNSVKIIDFGIARQGAANAKTTVRGTLYYLAPEQLQLQPPTPLSDLFSLAVVTYESLTRRRPFTGANESEVVEAIRHYSPPPVSEINHDVSYLISQVIHKAMAKQPWHRFFNMREFGDSLQKALRNEPLECFDSSKIKPRLQRAATSFEEGDYVFASEVLSELEAEGHLDHEIAMLRRQVDQAVRQTHIRQMLGSARRFFEATEYPLALRKIQEALELDPEDPDALSLKDQVEKERRARKISEWITLGKQHLDNNAFRQAREALENVVNVKPNDTEALGLLAEVGRREQEVSRMREEKSRLYQAAMNSWEKGEVTAALSRLEVLISMDRDHPESDSGRSGTYQNFYNQVHSEHNTLKSAYEEARRNLSKDNFEAAFATCRQYLAKYPNHALFQALQFDVEERQRQKLSGVIAETDRRVEAEPDLDKRAAILEEALKLYPGESHFERAMRLVRDKRDLVNSIVTKARFFEDRGQFNEALDQWQILKSIHDQQPGLAFEIQRLMKRRDQQAHDNTKARWVEQADKYLEGGDYDRAMQTVQSALAEFPGEAELLELDKLVRKNQERARQALEHLERAREFREMGSPELGLEALREAYQLDSRNTVIRTVLINSLLDQARRLVDSEWEAADGAVKEVLELEPKNPLAQSLASRIADRKRDDFIAWCLSQSRRLQTEGDIEGALAIAAQGLGVYPNEPRLQQLQATLQRAKVEADRQAPRPRETIETPKSKLKPGETVSAPAGPAPQPPPAPPAPAAPPTVVALEPPAARKEKPNGSSKKPGKNAAAKPNVPPATMPTPPLNQTIPSAGPTPPPPATSPSRSVPAFEPPRVSAAVSKPIGHNRILQGAAACVGVLAVVIAGIAIARHRQPVTPPAAAGKFKVRLTASPEGAAIKVNGDPCGTAACEVELAAGSYLAEAQLAGYQPATATFTAGPGTSSSSPIVLTLQPLTPRLTVATDLADGSIDVDGTAAGQIQAGAAEISNLTPGKHEISAKSGNSSVSFTLDIASGQMPALDGQIRATNLRGFVLVTAGTEAKVYGSMTGFRVTLDGKLAGNLSTAGLPLKDLAAGSHEVILNGPTGQRDKIVFESQTIGAVYASLLSDANMASLIVVADEDQADVFIDGVKYPRSVKQGHLQIYLPPKKYRIRVQKDGFTPVEQPVELHSFQETKAEFKLVGVKSVLLIHHTPPASEVLIDGKSVGTTRPDGEFSLTSLDAGKHSVQVRHDQFKPLQVDQTLTAGKTVEMDGTLESLLGTLHIDVTPADAHLRVRREGDARDREVTGHSASVPEGNYTVTGSAPHFQDGAATVKVTANHTANATLALKPAAAAAPPALPKPPTPQIYTLDDLQKTGGWTMDNGVLTRRGGEIVLLPVDFSQASIRFTVQSVKGKRTEWLLGYGDSKNYWLFQLDDKNFYRTVVSGGAHNDQTKVPHGLDRKGFVGIGIDITPTGIVHSVLRGGGWVPIDKWDFPQGSVRGKFGFVVPGKDELAVKEFSLTH